MLSQPSERTFISYSRKDGAKFAARLRERLLEAELSVWQDGGRPRRRRLVELDKILKMP